MTISFVIILFSYVYKWYGKCHYARFKNHGGALLIYGAAALQGWRIRSLDVSHDLHRRRHLYTRKQGGTFAGNAVGPQRIQPSFP